MSNRLHKIKSSNDTALEAQIPIYQKLVDEFKQAIISRELLPGHQVDSIAQIQVRQNVSRETAKRVLGILAKEGFIIQRPGKGSFVADLRPKLRMWGVVLPFYSVQYEELLQGLAQNAWKMGRELHHFVDHNDFKEEIRLVGTMIRERYEAVIVVPTFDESKTAEFYSRLSPQGTFVALMDHTMSGSYFSYVVQSYDLGVKRGISYLIDKIALRNGGSILFVRNEVWAGRNIIQEYMEETFKEVMQQNAADIPYIVIDSVRRIDAATVHELNAKAIFCCDDIDAVRIVGKLQEEGIKLPRDLNLVSYGNTDLARYFTPAITSLDPHSEEMTSSISNIIKARLSGENTSMCQYVVQPDLVVRET